MCKTFFHSLHLSWTFTQLFDFTKTFLSLFPFPHLWHLVETRPSQVLVAFLFMVMTMNMKLTTMLTVAMMMMKMMTITSILRLDIPESWLCHFCRPAGSPVLRVLGIQHFPTFPTFLNQSSQSYSQIVRSCFFHTAMKNSVTTRHSQGLCLLHLYFLRLICSLILTQLKGNKNCQHEFFSTVPIFLG